MNLSSKSHQWSRPQPQKQNIFKNMSQLDASEEFKGLNSEKDIRND